MLRIVICDDHADQLEKIRAACQEYFSLHPEYAVEIVTFDNPMECLEKLEKTGGCDIALLDICMPGISGISVAKEIMIRDSRTQVLFISTSDEYAVQAFTVGALHYLTKPFTRRDFHIGMDRVLKKFQIIPKYFYINGEGGALHKIDARELMYIESLRNDRCLYTEDGKCINTRRSLQDLLGELEVLCPGQFVSPYRGFVVNFAAVSAVTADGILLKNKKLIPIKPGSFRSLRSSYFAYAFGEEK